MDKSQARWTEIEHLPKWDEEFYDVYTAKKFGKWVMLKTLKDEFKGIDKYEAMIEKEFDTRYNLGHPNIVMINDFEDVPGIGRCIITDDVYGDSLRSLLDNGKVTQAHIDKLKTQFISALEYIQTNHIAHLPIRAKRIIFTENIGNWFDAPVNTAGGSIKSIKLCGTEVAGQELAKRLGLVSPCFNVSVQNGSFVFQVLGIGDGVGLSQNGADYLAEQGKSAGEILAYFYSGVQIQQKKDF